MNRIYQGRVTKVEIPDGKDGDGKPRWKELPEWRSTLWNHHQLFQDAVNYYTLCLACMAAHSQSALPADPENSRLRALCNWRTQVRDQWLTTTRKNDTYPGPHTTLAQRLDRIGADKAETFDEIEQVILRNQATPELRLAPLLRLLDLIGSKDDEKTEGSQKRSTREEADLTPKARGIMPPLFQRVLKGGDAVAANAQLNASQLEARKVRGATDETWQAVANELDIDVFLRTPPDPAKAYRGEPALERLRDCFESSAERFPALSERKADFLAAINRRVENAPRELIMPKGNKPPSVFHAMAVFKYFPCAETHAAAVRASDNLLQRTPENVTSDPLFDVRVSGIPPFEFFANLALEGSRKQKAQGVWFEFDLMAFVEALKAPHRYYQDTQKRERAAKNLRIELALIDSNFAAAHPQLELPKNLRAGFGKKAEDDVLAIYGFAEDKRIDLIRELVISDELASEAEAEAESDTLGGKIAYGIRERTLRGYEEVRRKWMQLIEKKEPTPAELKNVIGDIQSEHRFDFGDATLFGKLTEPHFQPIWRSSPAKDWHSPNALQAWMHYQNLLSDLRAKERPIRFSPAHAEKSPRYFAFPKASQTKEKAPSRRPVSPGLVSRHLQGEMTFYAGLVIERKPTPVKISYSSPRLLRDELRTGTADENLYQAKWLQPLVNALDFRGDLDRQNFANCRITLEPDANDLDNVQLTFPVKIESLKLRTKLEKAARWRQQFYVSGSGDFEPMALLWPGEPQSKKRTITWTALDEFRVLAVDLGQRTAGAFALLHITRKPSREARFIGETNGVKWFAELEHKELLRLSGEDRKEWQHGEWREEHFGSRGRSSTRNELTDASKLLAAFTVKDTDVLDDDWENELSFPEINDGLLRAARRALGRFSRLHRWRWFLDLGEKRRTAISEMCGELKDAAEAATKLGVQVEAETVTGELRSLLEMQPDDNISDELLTNLRRELDRRIFSHRTALPKLLCALANRVLPWRGKTWSWHPHPQRPDCFLVEPKDDPSTVKAMLRGQRGLSFARVEQIDELRKRFQSLNQLMRRNPGEPPRKRREESIPDPCPEIGDKLDRLKEQRVNQTAHMILAEALGMRLQPPPPDKAEQKRTRDLHGIYRQERPAVDFIVIENLSRYRTSQGRAPRENNRLMKWSHRAIRDKLQELCEPFGLPVLETAAAYSSRFCSRSGIAGFRAAEVRPRILHQRHWRNFPAVIAEKRKRGDKPSADEEQILEFLRLLGDARLSSSNGAGPTLLMPRALASHFVPLRDRVSDAELPPQIEHADLNAAINLALRSVAHPRNWRIHSRIRTNQRRVEKQDDREIPIFTVNEKRAFGDNAKVEIRFTEHHASDKDETRVPNFFFDFTRSVNWDTANIENYEMPTNANFISGKALWKTVKDRQWRRCNEINQQRLARLGE